VSISVAILKELGTDMISCSTGFVLIGHRFICVFMLTFSDFKGMKLCCIITSLYSIFSQVVFLCYKCNLQLEVVS